MLVRRRRAELAHLRITNLPPLKTTKVKNERKTVEEQGVKKGKNGKNGRILRGKMGKMSERIRTIDCPLSKKRVFRGARITIAEFGALRADTAKFEFLAGLLPLSDGNAWGMG